MFIYTCVNDTIAKRTMTRDVLSIEMLGSLCAFCILSSIVAASSFSFIETQRSSIFTEPHKP